MIYFDLATSDEGQMGGIPDILFEEYVNITMHFYAMLMAISPKNKECFNNIIESAITRATEIGLIQEMKKQQRSEREKKEIRKALEEYNEDAISYLKKNTSLS